MTLEWNTVLTADQIQAHHAAILALDPTFGKSNLCFWSSRTPNQLKNLRYGAWNANERETWVLANSYLALTKTEWKKLA